MESKAPSAATKDLDGQVRRILRPIDVLSLNRRLREQITDLNQALTDSKIYAQDYELSETREEQLASAKTAKLYLKKARSSILALSEYDIFSPLDVAHLTATIDQIISKLQ